MKKMKKGLWLPIISLSMAAMSCSGQSAKSNSSDNTTVSFPSPGPTQKETPLNTVTTTGSDGTQYKLVQIGDNLPKFYVNSKLIPLDDIARYASLIDRLEPILWERQKNSAQQNKAKAIRQQDAIVSDLVKDQIVKNQGDIFSFRLTADELIVNGKAQPYSIFSRYMKKYIKNNASVYVFNQSSK